MSAQLRLSFMTSADPAGKRLPGLPSPDSLNFSPTLFSRYELERRLLRLIDAIEHPQPRRRRTRFIHVGDIAA